MNNSLADRMQLVRPSPTLAIAAKAAKMQAEGLNIINLGVGEPDFDTPDIIKQAAINAIYAGFTKYTAVDGIAELKESIQRKFKRDNGLIYEPSQILVSTGGKQCIYNLCQALLNRTDEVIIPAPYWVSYPDIVLLAEATPVILTTDAKAHFKITPLQLEQAITPRTKLVFINSPSNPSGVAYTPSELAALGAVLMRYPQIYVATDDMYEHIIWSQPFVNILNVCPELYDRTIVLNGVSKAYAMTGWRIGYAAAHAGLINAMKIVQSQSTSNPCSIAQKAAVAALDGGYDFIKMMVNEFHKRHNYLIDALHAIHDIEVIPADGTFYVFPHVQKIIEKHKYLHDLDFSDHLLSEAGIALVPGSAFGAAGCIRLSFATSMDTLIDAMQRLKIFCNS